ncbi:MAG TPA: PadR family transcriptional regulator [Acidimicrobiales bacterium]|nr:PadR family transcriptional regulator [Acidimicrobiales bacterium]
MDRASTDRVVYGVQLKQFAKPCLLLLLQERPDYGYDLVTRLRALGVEDDSAAIYRVLRTLEAEGSVTSRWKEPVAGPARRMYQVTAEGTSILQGWAAALDESRRVLDGFLERYRQCRPAPGVEAPSGCSLPARRRALP